MTAGHWALQLESADASDACAKRPQANALKASARPLLMMFMNDSLVCMYRSNFRSMLVGGRWLFGGERQRERRRLARAESHLGERGAERRGHSERVVVRFEQREMESGVRPVLLVAARVVLRAVAERELGDRCAFCRLHPTGERGGRRNVDAHFLAGLDRVDLRVSEWARDEQRVGCAADGGQVEAAVRCRQYGWRSERCREQVRARCAYPGIRDGHFAFTRDMAPDPGRRRCAEPYIDHFAFARDSHVLGFFDVIVDVDSVLAGGQRLDDECAAAWPPLAWNAVQS